MKKTLLGLILTFSIFQTFGQITLEQTYSYKTLTAQPILFSSNGTKILVLDSSSNQVKLYNTDYSIWRTINVPTFANYRFINSSCVSDNLFNTDNNVEMVVEYMALSATTHPYYRAAVIDETGAIIQDLDSTAVATVHIIDGSYKLYTLAFNSAPHGMYNTKIYGLVGTMPCGQCGSLGLTKNGSISTGDVSNPMPNPNSGSTTIFYNLPEGYSTAILNLLDLSGRLVNSYPLERNSTHVTLNTAGLVAGTYFYTLVVDGSEIQPKKLIKL